jgi:phosphoglucosamine mutase
LRTKVGDRYVVEHMRAHGYNVGGEQSGHIVLSDFSTTGDGLVAALQVLAVVKRRASRSANCLPLLRAGAAAPQERPISGGKPLEEAPVRRRSKTPNRLGKAGRLVIRPSGTEPLIRVMAEGDDLPAPRRESVEDR